MVSVWVRGGLSEAKCEVRKAAYSPEDSYVKRHKGGQVRGHVGKMSDLVCLHVIIITLCFDMKMKAG